MTTVIRGCVKPSKIAGLTQKWQSLRKVWVSKTNSLKCYYTAARVKDALITSYYYQTQRDMQNPACQNQAEPLLVVNKVFKDARDVSVNPVFLRSLHSSREEHCYLTISEASSALVFYNVFTVYLHNPMLYIWTFISKNTAYFVVAMGWSGMRWIIAAVETLNPPSLSWRNLNL